MTLILVERRTKRRVVGEMTSQRQVRERERPEHQLWLQAFWESKTSGEEVIQEWSVPKDQGKLRALEHCIL